MSAQPVQLKADRIPPQDLDAELYVLGAVSLDRIAQDKACERLTADDFYLPRNQIIFRAVMELHAGNVTPEAFTLERKLREQGKLEEVGGVVFLVSLWDACASPANLEYYADIVKRKSHRRQMIAAAGQIIKAAYEDPAPEEELQDRAERAIFALGDRQDNAEIVTIGEHLKAEYDRLDQASREVGKLAGISTGYAAFDRKTGGQKPKTLTVVAGRPSQGKTSLVVSMALHVARNVGQPAVLFSLEMDGSDISRRVFAADGLMDLHRLDFPSELTEHEWDVMSHVQERNAGIPLVIDQSTRLTMSQMRARCRRVVSHFGSIGAIAVDYLQLVQPRTRRDTREQQVGEIARDLKDLAREMNCPVIALSQMSRDIEKRGKNSEPLLSDLRESGDIEAAADVVVFVHRPNYQDDPDGEDDTAEPEEAKLIIRKQRNGPKGPVRVIFVPRSAMFRDADDIHTPPEKPADPFWPKEKG